MTTFRVIALLFLAHHVVAQVYCWRVVGYRPGYERIFFAKGDSLRPETLRGVDDLGPLDRFPETNRIDRLFMDLGKERTNGFNLSCAAEVPLTNVTLRDPGKLIFSLGEVSGILNGAVVVPRASLTNHLGHYSYGARYVFSLIDSRKEEIVIDLRPGGCAVVFFPDQTFRCIMPSGYWCLKTQ